MSSLGFTNCHIQLRFNTGVVRATGENKRTLTPLWQSPLSHTPSGLCVLGSHS